MNDFDTTHIIINYLKSEGLEIGEECVLEDSYIVISIDVNHNIDDFMVGVDTKYFLFNKRPIFLVDDMIYVGANVAPRQFDNSIIIIGHIFHLADPTSLTDLCSLLKSWRPICSKSA